MSELCHHFHSKTALKRLQACVRLCASALLASIHQPYA